MTHPSSLPPFGRAYVWLVVSTGVLVIAHAIGYLSQHPIDPKWLVLAALTIISGSFAFRVPSVAITLSVSETFVFISILLFGTEAGILTGALEGLVISFWLQQHKKRLDRFLFNLSAPAVSIWMASGVFYHVSGGLPGTTLVRDELLPFLIFPIVYFITNSSLISVAIAFEHRTSPVEIFRRNVVWAGLSYCCSASVAVLLANYTHQVGLNALFVIGPILLVTHLTFRAALGRVQDAQNHLKEMNTLYFSTIQTLAMAIDAKDQITHGHIRRVQLHALALAKAVGIQDESELRGIEAAALLHDLGKLAIPEYILNKPGRLTPAEFAKMKTHALIGANILSSIEFPYPVVPYVRHHHENWDGSGYPDGKAGDRIPLGARILAVVDCYDALVSDRPYRPRLSEKEALDIITSRSGTMYDPHVVEAFCSIQGDLITDLGSGVPETTYSAIAQNLASPVDPLRVDSFDAISTSSDEMLALYEITHSLSSTRARFVDTAEAFASRLRRMMPVNLCVFFTYDSTSDELVAAHAIGDQSAFAKGLRIPLGLRLTGWVAANKQSIVNSDPLLDFGEVARGFRPRLRSCLSVPLVLQQNLIGTLTLHSTQDGAFTDDHRRIIEAIGKPVAAAMQQALRADRVNATMCTDAVTGLPNEESFRNLATTVCADLSDAPISILLLKVLDTTLSFPASSVTPETLGLIVPEIRLTLRGADILFRYSGDEFVILLSQTDAETAQLIAQRIASRLRFAFEGRLGAAPQITISYAVATSPSDGVSPLELITAARERTANVPFTHRSADRLGTNIH